ncbi:MAG: alpha-galactosidase, partial [Victivallales bacterium]|nr:alpha-galactosidase [Victivallales bacterium]
TWTEENAARDDTILVQWNEPMKGIMYNWQPMGSVHRTIDPDWCGPVGSMISCGAPLNCWYDGKGVNRLCVALSETKMLTTAQNGVVEENGTLTLRYRMGVKQFTGRYETCFTLRLDTRNIPMDEAVASAAQWWVSLGLTPAFVPEDAKKPCYSFWYSYHQNVNDKDVEDECRRAKAIGFDVCIIDDGWQTDDGNRGYAYCGDWQPTHAKFPDMAAHVRKVHEIGMKYILWYSGPFMGRYAEHLEEFSSMILRENRENEYILDPRYKKVREYLLQTYLDALQNWDLDGFKLDFIDSWNDSPDNAPYAPEMDIPSLQDAVDVFMTTVITELKRRKPDILLEFRQSYIGPRMRTFGNMFRVADCPLDYIKNRVGILDLRMTMGHSAVHSDMLMWHPEETAERDALQIISVLFGVMQYSAKLDTLNPRTEKMTRFWLDFMKEKQNVLLDGELRSYDPHFCYTWAESFTAEECVAAVYAPDKCIAPEERDTLYIANGAESDRVLCEICG